jgi:hypothetical protein
MNAHLFEQLARERLNEARAEAARLALVRALRPARPLRVVLGLALIRAGRWVAGRAARPTRVRQAIA